MKKHILLLDDDELVLKSLGGLLRRQGYEVTLTGDPEEALDYVREEHYDLVISDVRMPVMDGLQVLKKMRQIQQEFRRQRLREILITGFADESALREANMIGVSDYIYKPVDVPDFLERVRHALHQEKE